MKRVSCLNHVAPWASPRIVINEGIEKTIRSDIKLSVTYYLNDEGIADNDLQNVLITNTHKVANDEVRVNKRSL